MQFNLDANKVRNIPKCSVNIDAYCNRLVCFEFLVMGALKSYLK